MGEDFIASMARFIRIFIYIGTISLLLLLVTASPQFDAVSTSDLGDSVTPQAPATSLNPGLDALPDDA